MENFMMPYDKEFMKMAMLKHEETFREQVYELHRLYQIQKMLMKNMPQSNGKGQNKETYLNNYLNESSRKQKSCIEQPATKEYVTQVSGDGGVEIEEDEENELELTLAPSSFQRRRSKSDTPLNSDSALSMSSSSSGSSQIKRGETKRDNMNTNKWGSNPSFLSGRKKNSDLIEEQMRQDRVNQQPPWLYQVLSLNMT